MTESIYWNPVLETLSRERIRKLQLKKFKRFLTMKPPAVKAQLQSADHLISDMLDLVAFFGRAKTDVTVVDTDLGDATLDCLKKVQSRIKLLTCQQPDRFEQNFTKALSHFRQKGRKIEIRMHADIHDRYIVFNDKCWNHRRHRIWRARNH